MVHFHGTDAFLSTDAKNNPLKSPDFRKRTQQYFKTPRRKNCACVPGKIIPFQKIIIEIPFLAMSETERLLMKRNRITIATFVMY